MTENMDDKEGKVDNPDEESQADKNIAELEQKLSDRENEIQSLKKSETGLKEKLADAVQSLAIAVSSYKNRVIQLNPGVTEELISGDTIEAVDRSLDRALDLIGKVKKSVENEISHTRIPAGAPPRQPLDLSGLSPREKIQYAVGGKK